MRLIDRDKLLDKVQYFGNHPTYDDPMANYTAAVTEEDILNADEYTIDEYTKFNRKKIEKFGRECIEMECDCCGYTFYAESEEDRFQVWFCPHCGRNVYEEE